MKYFPASDLFRFPGVITLLLVASVLWVSALATAVAAETQICQQDSQAAATQYVLDLKTKADVIVEKNDAPLARMKAHVSQIVEFDPLAKFALGRYWNTATRDQRQEYRRLFKLTLLHTLASKLLQFRGARLEIVRQNASGPNSILLISKVIPWHGISAQIGWRIGFKNCRPIAIDLLKNGVSLITTKRQEFNAAVSRRGMDGLMSLLKSQLRKQSLQTGSSPLDNKAGNFVQQPRISVVLRTRI